MRIWPVDSEGREFRSFSDIALLCLILIIAMSLYAFLRLSHNPMVFRVSIGLLVILEAVKLWFASRESTRTEVAIEAAFFVVLISIVLGPITRYEYAFLFSTILYRPDYLRHGNRVMALTLSLLIAAVVLPITCGLVTDRSSLNLLSWLYASFVFCFWLTCSKLGAWVGPKD